MPTPQWLPGLGLNTSTGRENGKEGNFVIKHFVPHEGDKGCLERLQPCSMKNGGVGGWMSPGQAACFVTVRGRTGKGRPMVVSVASRPVPPPATGPPSVGGFLDRGEWAPPSYSTPGLGSRGISVPTLSFTGKGSLLVGGPSRVYLPGLWEKPLGKDRQVLALDARLTCIETVKARGHRLATVASAMTPQHK